MILPFFKSHYSIGRSILTLSDIDESKDSGGPDSIINLSVNAGLKEVFLVEDSMTGFIQAYHNFQKYDIKLIFGLRLTVCNDISQKNEESRRSEHKIVVFCKDFAGYQKLIKISTQAAREGFYYYPRIDFKNLKEIWEDKELMLGVPFYDSFLFKNLLTTSICVPELDFTSPWFFLEKNDLPFDSVLENLVLDYCDKNKFKTLKAKSIYYKMKKDFKSYLTFRCINNRSTLDKPQLEHMSSEEFSFESWEKVNG